MTLEKVKLSGGGIIYWALNFLDSFLLSFDQGLLKGRLQKNGKENDIVQLKAMTNWSRLDPPCPHPSVRKSDKFCF